MLARWDILTHEYAEYLISSLSILDGHTELLPLYWIHRRLPELLRIHLSETLVPLDSLSGNTLIDDRLEFLLFVVHVPCLFPFAQLVEWRVGDEYMTIVHQRTEVAEEKC